MPRTVPLWLSPLPFVLFALFLLLSMSGCASRVTLATVRCPRCLRCLSPGLAEDGTRGQRDAQRQGEVEGLGRLARHVDGLAKHVCQSQPRSDNMLAAGTVVHLALAKTLVP
jgi:hypothetical protein